MPSDTPRSYRYYDLILALFVSVLLISNIASAAKMVDWRVSLVGVPLQFDAGTLMFPLSYIFGDILTEVYGYRRSRRVIWAGFVILALMAGLMWVVGRLPGTPEWEKSVGQSAFNAVLGGFFTGGIILASLVAYWAGEFSNSYVLAKMKILTRGRWLWTRTIGSTLVGEGVDTGLFVVIATLCRVSGFEWSNATAVILTNYIYKVGIEAVMTPVTYRVVGFLKRHEREDYYDYGTNFNPFRVTA